MNRHVTVSALLALLSGCFGMCGGGDQEFYAEPGCIDGGGETELTLVIGIAEGEGFRELSNGSELEMDYGPQGGQHIYVSYRVYGAQNGDRVDLQLASGGIGESSYATPLAECPAEQAWEVLDDYVEFAAAEEQTTTLTVTLLRCNDPSSECIGGGGGPEFEVIATRELEVTAIP